MVKNDSEWLGMTQDTAINVRRQLIPREDRTQYRIQTPEATT